MTDIGYLTPDQARIVWQTVLELRQSGLLNRRNHKPPAQTHEHRVFIRNDSGETIPGFGCMQVTGTAPEEGRVVVTVAKPSSLCGEYLFCSPYEIEAGGCGWAYAWGLVRMLGTASTYESCKRYAPIVGAWGVVEAPGPFLVYGEDGEQEGVVIGRIVGDHCQARWISFTYTGSNPVSVDAFYDGTDPSDCGSVNVSYPLGVPPCGGQVIAFYDPNTGNYQGFSTKSALLGESTAVDVMIGDLSILDCEINYTLQNFRMFPCGSSSVPSYETIPTHETSIVKSIGVTGCSLTGEIQNVKVIACAAEETPTAFSIPFATQTLSVGIGLYLDEYDGLCLERRQITICATGSDDTDCIGVEVCSETP